MNTSHGVSLSNLGTNGIRGQKRPRYPKKHLVTCKESSTNTASINCECDKYDQDPTRVNGYYETESDDIDVPLSKRINRLNIENTSISNGHHSNSPFIADRSSNNVSPMLPETNNVSLNSVGNDNQSNRHLIPPDGSLANNNQQTQNNWQQSHISHTVGDINKQRANPSHDPSVPIDIRNNSSNFHHDQLDLSTSFRERYEYPENSLYYHSNQLLYNLFRERQMRQNDSAS